LLSQFPHYPTKAAALDRIRQLAREDLARTTVLVFDS
jgi:hypothetical protein